MYIVLYIFWKNEDFCFQNWQNLIGKLKWLRARLIRNWKNWSLRKRFFLPVINTFWEKIFFNRWFISWSYKILSEKFWWLIWYNTAQKMKFSIKDFFSKCDQIQEKEEILNGKLHFLYSVIYHLNSDLSR